MEYMQESVGFESMIDVSSMRLGHTGCHVLWDGCHRVRIVPSRYYLPSQVMRHLPKKVLVVGGGYIAVEFANIFYSFTTLAPLENIKQLLVS